jgi:lambda family phage minor tail protein L
MNYVVTGYWLAGYVTSDSEAEVTSALQEIAPGALIELFQLELNVAQHGVAETYYFHAGTNANGYGNLVWDGQAYMALPIEVEGFEYSGQGTLPRPKMRISNLMGTITALILTLPEGLEGAKFTRIRTLGRFLDAVNFPVGSYVVSNYWAVGYESGTSATADPLAEFPREVYFVDRKSAENRDVVEFEMASAFDMAGVRAPKRQCITRCQWVYRSPECSYTSTNYFNVSDVVVGNASEDVCGKRVDSCKVRFGQNAELPHGGFVGIGSYFA